MGKAVGKDAAKATLHAAGDAAAAKARLAALAAEAVAALVPFGPAADTLREAASFAAQRGGKGVHDRNVTRCIRPVARQARFLIIGGASLVGSTTAELLLAEGAAEVTVLDNFYQGTPEAIRHIEGDPRLKIVTAT